jgi:hypothetical protein
LLNDCLVPRRRWSSIKIWPQLTDGSGLGKCFSGRAKETEAHVLKAFRLSPRDSKSYDWMAQSGVAKSHLGDDDAAVASFRRSIETNRNAPRPCILSRRRSGASMKACAWRGCQKAKLSANVADSGSKFGSGLRSDEPLLVDGTARDVPTFAALMVREVADAEYVIDTNANLDERLRRRRNIDQGNFLRTRRIRGSRDDDAASDGLVERFGLA